MCKADLTLGYTEVKAKVLRQHNKTTKNSQGNCEEQGSNFPLFPIVLSTVLGMFSSPFFKRSKNQD